MKKEYALYYKNGSYEIYVVLNNGMAVDWAYGINGEIIDGFVTASHAISAAIEKLKEIA